jgi:thiamine-phosphate pyrophosphorylase
MKVQKTKFYLITDRKLLSKLYQPHPKLIPSQNLNTKNLKLDKSLENLLFFCFQASLSGVDIIQIREKDLSARDLANFVSILTSLVKNTIILVNDRLDIALSSGASGVHLPSNSFLPKDVRKIAGNNFFISMSTHSIEEAKMAEDQGADFILFSPIFDTPSKRIYGKPLGLDLLKEATSKIKTPIIALGGINKENAQSVLECGASGLAAIRLFIETQNLVEFTNDLRGK